MIKFKKFVFLNLGCALTAIAAVLYFTEAKIPSGGMYSVAMMIYNACLTSYSPSIVGIIAMLMNIPILAAAFLILPRNYFYNSLYCSIAYPSYLYIFGEMFNPVHIGNSYQYVSFFIFFTIIYSLGIAVALFFGGNTGGTDILAQILKHYFPKLPIWICILFINSIIFATAIMLLGLPNAITGVIAVCMSSFLIGIYLNILKYFKEKLEKK